MAEASRETITGNLFYGNKVGAISLPLLSPRSHDNISDDNAIEREERLRITDNSGRIPAAMIQRECRDRPRAADVPESQWPGLSESKQLPILSLPTWQIVMQMDKRSTSLPANFRMHLDKEQKQLQIDLPSADAIPITPPGGQDDFDLLGQAVKAGDTRAGAIQNLHAGHQKITIWPLPAVARPPSAP
jgi:hypothetical protein